MRPLIFIIFALIFAACKQSTPTKKLVIEDLKYSAYYWHFNEKADSFEFYLVHYINIDKNGKFVLMRHNRWMDKPKYFKGSINDTIRRYIDTALLNDNFKTDYSYMTNPNFLYDGFTYCFDYRTEHNKRKQIQFVPHNSPAKINILNTILDTFIYSIKSEISDTLDLKAYTKELNQLFENIEPPPKKLPPPTLKVILFKPPKSSK